jgi:uncharacterized delta-60 repeat protein
MFGNSGSLMLPTRANYGQDFALYSLPEGRLFVGGSDFIVQFDGLGNDHPAFGSSGYVFTPQAIASIAVQPDGKVLVADLGFEGWRISRYHPDGTLDTGFGDQGVFLGAVGASWGDTRARSIVVQSDGKILVTGDAPGPSDNDVAVARLTADGRLDKTFGGGDGVVLTDLADVGGPHDHGRWVFAVGGGKIVVAGLQTGGPGGDAFTLVRYDAAGQLDTGFGTGGVQLTPAGGGLASGFGIDAARMADGRFVLSQSVWGADGLARTIARYTADGKPDTSFGNKGVLTLGPGTPFGVPTEGLAVQADGKLVLTGPTNTQAGTSQDVLVVRLHADGSLDTGFGTGGSTVVSVGSIDMPSTIAVQANGKIVVAGSADRQAFVLRLNADGSVDNGQARQLGTAGDDALQGSSGDDDVGALEGNDTIRPGSGNDQVDGGAGVDLVVLSGRYADYDVVNRGHHWVLSDSVAGRDGTDQVLNVERLRFADGYLSLELFEGHGGEAYRLYKAAFDRTPDVAGLGYQINALDQGLSLLQVAQNFIDSPEFARTYGSLDSTQFVTQLYANVLDRAPDDGGLAFHTQNLAAGMSRAAVLVGFSESPENRGNMLMALEDGIFYTL